MSEMDPLELAVFQQMENARNAEPSAPPPKLCEFNRMFSGSLAALIKQAPENDVVRAKIQSVIKVPLPDEVKTYSQIVEWVEANILPNPAQAKVKSDSMWDLPYPTNPQRPAGIIVPISASETASGTCNFCVTRQGTSEFRLSNDDLVRMVETAMENRHGLGDLVESIKEYIHDNAPTIECDDDVADTETHEDYDTLDTSDYELQVRTSNVERALRDWLSRQPIEIRRAMGMAI